MSQIRLPPVPGFLLTSLVSTLAATQSAHAADWIFDPRVSLSANYITNYGLDLGNAQGANVAGPIFDAGVRIRYIDPLTQFEITPRARSTVYPGHAQDQSNDQFINSRFEHDWRTAQLTVDGFYWRQDILQSYLPSTEVGTPLGQNTGGADLGAINQKIRQDFLFLTPGLMLDLTPRERIELRTQFMDIDYSKQVPGNNEDFKNYAGSAGWQYSITQLSTITVRGTGTKLSPTAGSGAETYGLEGEWRTRSSEVLQAYARLGVDHTTFDSVAGSQSFAYNRSSATSYAGGVGLSRKFVRNDLFVDVDRTVSPNSAGAVVARNELRLRLEHEFNARMSAYVGLRGIKEDALGNSTAFVSQRYGRAAIGYEWRITREFSLVPEYAYTTLKQGNFGAPGSNSVMISLVYEPHRPVTETGVRIGL
jgi:hypothetical protein